MGIKTAHDILCFVQEVTKMYSKRISIFISFGIAVLITLVGTNSIAKEEGLILYLPFDEGSGDKVKDHSDTKLDGTVNGNADWVKGIKGDALSFDGETAYVELPASDVLLEADEEVTFSLWFNAKEVEEGGPPDWTALDCLIGRAHNGDVTMFLSYGSLYAMFDTGGWLYLPADPVALGAESGEIEIETNKWYQAVATYEAPVGRLYLDGELVAEDEGPGGPITYQGDNWTQIGGFRGSMHFFNGVIDEVKIYDRALTPKEITQISPVILQEKLTTTWGWIKEMIW